MTRAAARGSVLLMTPWPWLFSMPGGGGTPIEADLLHALIGAGFDVEVLAPHADRASGFEELPGVHLHHVGRARIPPHGPLLRFCNWVELNARFALQALKVVRTNGRPRVVYGMSAFTALAAYGVGRLLGRPTVGVLLGTFLYPLLDDRRALRGAFEELIAFKLPFDRLVLLDDGTRADRVAQRLGVPAERTRFWMSGTRPAACRDAVAGAASVRDELGLPSGAPLIVSASRLASWKRIDRILDALPRVLAEVPDALLVLSGAGPEEQALRDQAARSGVADHVRFVGALPRDTNLRLIATSEVFVSFYDYSNVGVALLEALGCAVPIVAADTGATSELLDSGAGIVVPPDDATAAANAIIDVLTRPELAARLRSEAAEVARTRLLTVEDRAALELEMLAGLLDDASLTQHADP